MKARITTTPKVVLLQNKTQNILIGYLFHADVQVKYNILAAFRG
jgi:hypothetical protein